MTLENPRHLDHRPIKQHLFCKSRFSEVRHLASMVRYGRSGSRSSLIPAACMPAAISLPRQSPKNLFHRLEGSESLLPLRGMARHADWMRISKSGHGTASRGGCAGRGHGSF